MPRSTYLSRSVVAAKTMQATLFCDHRILYRAGAARFLARIEQLLESRWRWR